MIILKSQKSPSATVSEAIIIRWVGGLPAVGRASEARHLIWSFLKGGSERLYGDTVAHIRHKMAVFRLAPAGLLLSHMQMSLSQ